ncbi:hypothetical protein G7Y89_g7820 [Cudoniella acicularis]|uniref:SNF2 N-terminal domain-containing protein n=1 Tax=Cudoniella acicularis TaxID=354080 RepID=A0A8H4RK27_9HELO|nr:hypothetical protein G7Y89_g7820 [Cudoniella acicularis]
MDIPSAVPEREAWYNRMMPDEDDRDDPFVEQFQTGIGASKRELDLIFHNFRIYMEDEGLFNFQSLDFADGKALFNEIVNTLVEAIPQVSQKYEDIKLFDNIDVDWLRAWLEVIIYHEWHEIRLRKAREGKASLRPHTPADNPATATTTPARTGTALSTNTAPSLPDTATTENPPESPPFTPTRAPEIKETIFRLIVMSDDRTRQLEKFDIDPKSCLENLKGRRDGTWPEDYELSMIIKTFQNAIGAHADPYIRALNLKRGQLGYDLRGHFKEIKDQKHLVGAIRHGFYGKPGTTVSTILNQVVEFIFHPETPVEKRLREDREKAARRARETARKTKEQAGAATISGRAETPAPAGRGAAVKQPPGIPVGAASAPTGRPGTPPGAIKTTARTSAAHGPEAKAPSKIPGKTAGVPSGRPGAAGPRGAASASAVKQSTEALTKPTIKPAADAPGGSGAPTAKGPVIKDTGVRKSNPKYVFRENPPVPTAAAVFRPAADQSPKILGLKKEINENAPLASPDRVSYDLTQTRYGPIKPAGTPTGPQPISRFSTPSSGSEPRNVLGRAINKGKNAVKRATQIGRRTQAKPQPTKIPVPAKTTPPPPFGIFPKLYNPFAPKKTVPKEEDQKVVTQNLQDERFKRFYEVAKREVYERGGVGDGEDDLPVLLGSKSDKADEGDEEVVLKTEVSNAEGGDETDEEAGEDGPEILTRHLQELQSSSELSQLMPKGQVDDLSRWRECCAMFQINPDKTGMDERVRIAGLKTQLYQYQAFGVWWQMNKSRSLGGGFVADEMGLGKTLSFLAYIVVERQLAWLWDDIYKSRANKDGKHLGIAQQGLEDTACPSNHQRPHWITCPCVSESPTSSMPPQLGVRLACVPAPLIPHWMEEWRIHIDQEEMNLGMRIAVAHNPTMDHVAQMKGNDSRDTRDARHLRNRQYLRSNRPQDVRGRPIPSYDERPQPGQERFLLLCSLLTYQNWVLKAFAHEERVSAHHSGPSRGLTENIKKRGIVFGIAMVDECHEDYLRSKGRSALLAELPREPRPFIWGYSGTPLLNTPRALEGILWAIETHTPHSNNASTRESLWSQDEQMSIFSVPKFDRFCAQVEGAVKIKGGIQPLLKDVNYSVLHLLRTFMIRRTAESTWFGHPLVKLRPHYHQDVTLKHNPQFNKFLARRAGSANILIRSKLDALRDKYFDIYPTSRGSPPDQLTLSGQCRAAWQMRVLATIPFLSRPLTATQESGFPNLELTPEETHQMIREGQRSFFAKNIKSIFDMSPKLNWLYDFIRRLMLAKDYSQGDNKLVIMTAFAPVALAVKLMIEKYILMGTVKDKVGLIIPRTPLRERTATLDAFTDAMTPRGRKSRYNYQFLVGTTRQIGTGLQLTRAANLVLMEPDIEFSREVQAYCRVHRIGQKNDESWSFRLIDEESPMALENLLVKREKDSSMRFGRPVSLGRIQSLKSFYTATGFTSVDEDESEDNRSRGPSGYKKDDDDDSDGDQGPGGGGSGGYKYPADYVGPKNERLSDPNLWTTRTPSPRIEIGADGEERGIYTHDGERLPDDEIFWVNEEPVTNANFRAHNDSGISNWVDNESGQPLSPRQVFEDARTGTEGGGPSSPPPPPPPILPKSNLRGAKKSDPFDLEEIAAKLPLKDPHSVVVEESQLQGTVTPTSASVRDRKRKLKEGPLVIPDRGASRNKGTASRPTTATSSHTASTPTPFRQPGPSGAPIISDRDASNRGTTDSRPATSNTVSSRETRLTNASGGGPRPIYVTGPEHEARQASFRRGILAAAAEAEGRAPAPSGTYDLEDWETNEIAVPVPVEPAREEVLTDSS